jgi:hypothetical protein
MFAVVGDPQFPAVTITLELFLVEAVPFASMLTCGLTALFRKEVKFPPETENVTFVSPLNIPIRTPLEEVGIAFPSVPLVA